jgi:hypothetical protein
MDQTKKNLNISTRALLASQYDQPNIISIIDSLCGSDALELTLQGTLNSIELQPGTREVGTAIGAQLDGIGDIVGVLREGRTDDVYRPLVAAQSLKISSSGTFNNVMGAIATLTTQIGSGNTPEARVREIFPQSLYIVIFQVFGAFPANITSIIKQSCAAPIGISIVGTNGQLRPFDFGGATKSFILTLNGIPLEVNSTYQIGLSIVYDEPDSTRGFGVAPFASICG